MKYPNCTMKFKRDIHGEHLDVKSYKFVRIHDIHEQIYLFVTINNTNNNHKKTKKP